MRFSSGRCQHCQRSWVSPSAVPARPTDVIIIIKLSLSKALNPHCFSGLSCEMSKSREHHREACLFSAMSYLEEISIKNQTFFQKI